MYISFDTDDTSRHSLMTEKEIVAETSDLFLSKQLMGRLDVIACSHSESLKSYSLV
jgi:hypothetical protein